MLASQKKNRPEQVLINAPVNTDANIVAMPKGRYSKPVVSPETPYWSTKMVDREACRQEYMA